MYRLIKIEYGRNNIPEPVSMPAQPSLSYRRGMLLELDRESHKMKVASGDRKATHVCLEDKTAGEGELISCFRVTGQMIFEAPLSALGDAQAVGAYLQISADGMAVTATAATVGRGAQIENLQNATAAGDTVAVRLA